MIRARPRLGGGGLPLVAPSGVSLKKMLLTLIAVAVLPAGGLALGQAFHDAAELRELQRRAAIATVERYAARQEKAIEAARAALRATRGAPEVLAGQAGPACDAAMDRIVDASAVSAPLGAYFISADGFLICGSGGLAEPVDLRDRDSFRTFSADPRSRVDVVVGRVSNEQVLVITEPVFAADEAFAGGLSIALTVTALQTTDAATDLVAVVSEDPTVWAGPDWALAASRYGVDLPDVDGAAAWWSVGDDGDRRLLAMATIDQTMFRVLARWDDGAIASRVVEQSVVAVALPLAAWVLASAILYVALDRLVIDNLVRVRAVSNALTHNNLSARVRLPANAPHELIEVGNDFNVMAETITNKNKELEALVAEQRVLLREVYHRVKNNLQLVVSLLNLQARDLENPAERAALERTKKRVLSMAAVHQNLYETGRLSEVRLNEVLSDVAASLRGDAGLTVRFQMDVEEVLLDTERALPAALFATEVLTNAVKYSADSAVLVSLRANGRDGFSLTVKNALGDGVETGRGGLGTRLIEAFAKQLRGDLRYGSDGDAYVVTLKVKATTAED